MTKGYPSSEKLESTSNQFQTVQPVGLFRQAADVLSHQYVTLVNADAVEALSTKYDIVATAHNAKKGQVVRMTSGSTSGEYSVIVMVSTNLITLGQGLSAVPSVADTFDIMRFVLPEAGPGGASSVTVSTAAKTMSDKVRYSHAVAVTTAAYTTLIASVAAAINVLYIDDTSGESLFLAVGAAASEVNLLIIPPGGFSGPVQVAVAAGARLSLKAISADTASGECILNGTN